MQLHEIPEVGDRPNWMKALSLPLREVCSADGYTQDALNSCLAHFARRGATPDVAVKFMGRIYLGAQ